MIQFNSVVFHRTTGLGENSFIPRVLIPYKILNHHWKTPRFARFKRGTKLDLNRKK